VISSQGHFEFEKRPGERIRFFSTSIGLSSFGGNIRLSEAPQFDSKESTERFVMEMRGRGYNMLRLHRADTMLVMRSARSMEFDPDYLDRLEYLIFCLKKNGVYLNLDCMTSRLGYDADPWKAKDPRNFKYMIYFDDEIKDHWRRGVRKLLTTPNRYTGTTLADDPVLALTVCFNEQEFAFISSRDMSSSKNGFNQFLSQKYGSVDALKREWRNEADSAWRNFSDVPALTPKDIRKGTPAGRDINEFIMLAESGLYSWYVKELRGMGYRGIISNLNMGKSFRHICARRNFEAVTMNAYHDHPSSCFSGGTVTQTSSLGNSGNLLRNFAATRACGRPYVVTEFGQAFWNRHRYEQAFVTAGYGAFQDFDGLTAFASAVNVSGQKFPAFTFAIASDPVALAQEFLAAHLFAREDVAPGRGHARIIVSPKTVFGRNMWDQAVNAAQSKLALVVPLGVEVSDSAAQSPAPGEIMISADGGGMIVQGEMFSSIQDSGAGSYNIEKLINTLRERKILSDDNRTNPAKGVWESEGGELYLDSGKRLMTVNTARFQGLAAPAGNSASLRDVEIKRLTSDGVLAVMTASPGTIATASRLTVVYATNALNTNMEFDEAEQFTLRNAGTAPALIKTGAFSLVLKNQNAKEFSVWALDAGGVRRDAIPVREENGGLVVEADTAKLPCGAAIYFEITKNDAR
jgi:hypothetical protein